MLYAMINKMIINRFSLKDYIVCTIIAKCKEVTIIKRDSSSYSE